MALSDSRRRRRRAAMLGRRTAHARSAPATAAARVQRKVHSDITSLSASAFPARRVLGKSKSSAASDRSLDGRAMFECVIVGAGAGRRSCRRGKAHRALPTVARVGGPSCASATGAIGPTRTGTRLARVRDGEHIPGGKNVTWTGTLLVATLILGGLSSCQGEGGDAQSRDPANPAANSLRPSGQRYEPTWGGRVSPEAVPRDPAPRSAP